ncbi:GNAT family N-acetyltransferase [Moraxella bovis]|uniref:GNAT family N-acetyltransferase n=1 Tax=Moraxella bovis TaxID=476 RepID=UPI002225EA93|nr:GNAT family N-acetyltransferase [Moraxella bovis]UYZ68086.1 GNAT family N-acetyltransferase [Moraxella bovis]UYZ70467.1 GNAT family N-acetyltransferase [Moraxella bovis]UYZ73613.1 GNAT family N-acetyltransferase [Moraxella bovis]UZA13769.1 GNAT family N-acetyltransferase [Moraxella bovis]UZA27879.1 GNAT family N-acetyltransferase [Moraxella bovis]
MQIRFMTENDIPQTFELMKALAVFEHYIDSFAITPDIVKEKGIDKNPPDFYCLVADDNGIIAGMLVYYFLPYTAQNRPAIYMKELFVDEKFRSQKVGEQLMLKLKQVAKENNCQTIKWTVAPWNDRGMKFYERLGAKQNTEWVNYELAVE